MPLFDEKQIFADLNNSKITSLDFSKTFMRDEKAELKNTATLRGHEDVILYLAVLPDGRLVSSSRDNTIKVWNVNNGTCLTTLCGHTGFVSVLTVLPDGRLVSGSYDSTLKVWDVNSGTCVAAILILTK